MVVPKCEVDYIFDLEDNELAAMHVFAKSVALAIQKVFPCKKVGEAVIGLEVPHAHIHLIPIQKESDMRMGSRADEHAESTGGGSYFSGIDLRMKF